MKKMSNTAATVLQFLFPVIFLLYFGYYGRLKEAIYRANISFAGILGYILVYFLLLILLIYVAFNSCKNRSPLAVFVLPWLEAVVIYILPLTSAWNNELFMQIKGYPMEYLYLYGVVVLAYSVPMVWRLHRR